MQPVVGGLPRRVGLAALLLAVLPRGWVGAEEFHPRQPGVQVAQAVGNDLVAKMTTAQVDDEAMVLVVLAWSVATRAWSG